MVTTPCTSNIGFEASFLSFLDKFPLASCGFPTGKLVLVSCKGDLQSLSLSRSLAAGVITCWDVKRWSLLGPMWAQNPEQGSGGTGGSTPESFPGSESSEGTDNEEDAVFDKSNEARAAVAEFLVKGGLSLDDALWVSAKAPMYVQKLMDADRELSEVGILTVPGVSVTGEDAAIYRFRLLQRAYQSSGRQLAPFLEAIGVRVSQISRIGHQLSGRNLAELLEKVRFLEKLLAPADGGKLNLENQLHRMMKRMSLDIDDDLQRVLSLFARVLHKGFAALPMVKRT